MAPEEIQESVVLDQRFGVFLFLEKRFSTFHDHIGVEELSLGVIFEEDLFVYAADHFLHAAPHVFGSARTGSEEAVSYEEATQQGHEPSP